MIITEVLVMSDTSTFCGADGESTVKQKVLLMCGVYRLRRNNDLSFQLLCKLRAQSALILPTSSTVVLQCIYISS